MTILRKAEHQALKGITFKGSVIDLGGHANSEYVKYLGGNFTRTTANLSEDANIQCDFEKPLPITSSSYDGALLINVLEHIFEYRQLLSETARILKPGGRVVIIVPFMFPYHPSPNDYHRYTEPALERAMSSAGFHDIRIKPLGSGVFSVRWLMIERLLPSFLRPISIIVGPFAVFSDWFFARIASVLGKKYRPSDYALGYVAIATKSLA